VDARVIAVSVERASRRGNGGLGWIGAGACPVPARRAMTPEVIDVKPVGGRGSEPPTRSGTEESAVSMAANSARGWSVEGWRAFWRAPSPEAALKRVPTVVTPDVEAVWPRIPGRVRGSGEYARRIVDLLAVVPDLRLELGEHAARGEFVFLRWMARGTGPDGPFEGIGTDRFRLRGGLVAESLIMSDLPVFEALARFVGSGGRPGAA
jgi:SnoaL-like domain